MHLQLFRLKDLWLRNRKMLKNDPRSAAHPLVPGSKPSSFQNSTVKTKASIWKPSRPPVQSGKAPDRFHTLAHIGWWQQFFVNGLLFLEQDLVGGTRLLLQGLLLLEPCYSHHDNCKLGASKDWIPDCLKFTLILQVGGLEILFELLVPLDQMPLGSTCQSARLHHRFKCWHQSVSAHQHLRTEDWASIWTTIDSTCISWLYGYIHTSWLWFSKSKVPARVFSSDRISFQMDHGVIMYKKNHNIYCIYIYTHIWTRLGLGVI